MNDEPLLNELAEIELLLSASRIPIDLAAERRVAASVHAAFAREQRRQNWRWFLTAAAAALIGLHVSWWGAQAGWSAPRAADDIPQLTAQSELLRELVPDLSPAEADRQVRLALLSESAGRTPARSVQPLPRPFGFGGRLD